MLRSFVCSRSNWDEVNCGLFRSGETRYLSARENENSSEKTDENLDDGIHNFDREMNTGWFPQNHSGNVDVIESFGRLGRWWRRSNFTSMPSSRARSFKKRNGKLAAAFPHMVNGVEEVGYDKKKFNNNEHLTTSHSGAVVINAC